MTSRSNGRQAQQRAHIAREAARVMVEGGIRDFQLAKRKALERLRLGDARVLPRNDEIEAAVHEYQRLFRADRQPAHLDTLRRVAIEAMRLLAPFKPRLVGPVLTGSADEHSEVWLHLFSDPPEEVGWFLMERRIPHTPGERRLRMAGDDTERLPTYRFLAGEVGVELVVFSARFRSRVPLSPVDGRPMRRANLESVEALTVSEMPGSP
jgi:hypothetical protein